MLSSHLLGGTIPTLSPFPYLDFTLHLLAREVKTYYQKKPEME